MEAAKRGKSTKTAPPVEKKSWRWHTRTEVIDALRETGGCVSKAARRLSMSVWSVHQRIASNPSIAEELKQIRQEAEEEHVDDAEVGLRELVKERNLGAIIFTLKTKGRHRGYVERVETTSQSPAEMAKEIQKTLREMEEGFWEKSDARPLAGPTAGV